MYEGERRKDEEQWCRNGVAVVHVMMPSGLDTRCSNSIFVYHVFAVCLVVFGGALVGADSFVFFHLLRQEGVGIALQGSQRDLERGEVCDAVVGG